MSKPLNYFLYRILSLIPVLFGISIIVFSVIHWIPGDPALLIAGPNAPVEIVENLRIQLGLDQPIHIQYLKWISGVIRGDLGRSIASKRLIRDEISVALGFTGKLTLVSISVATAIGIPLGVLTSAKRNTMIDYFITLESLVSISMPTFWIALLLIVIFSLQLGWLPTSGSGTPTHIILPSLSIAIYCSSIIARTTRSCMLDTLGQDYIRTAKAKGCSNLRIFFKHALKNALLPVITVIGMQLGSLFAGTVVIENVFGWPGLGHMMMEAVLLRDYPVIQGTVLITALIFVLVNLITDFLYAVIDPRVKI
jgi:ABC-type dipeptide/oligopeptide/nickel transport system permease component